MTPLELHAARNRILQEVSAKHRLSPETITGHCRRADIVRARRELWSRWFSELHMSRQDIARIAGREWTSVHHALRMVGVGRSTVATAPRGWTFQILGRA
jgi:chromosomal replication initiation ATPase DnaA